MNFKPTAIDIAKLTINIAINNEKPISNLQLQKILYYIQGEFIRRYGQLLFEDKILATAYGPQIPNVYYNYNRYASSEITNYQPKVEVGEGIISIIEKVLGEVGGISAWFLVSATKNEYPWLISYKEKNENTIKENDLLAFFLGKYEYMYTQVKKSQPLFMDLYLGTDKSIFVSKFM